MFLLVSVLQHLVAAFAAVGTPNEDLIHHVVAHLLGYFDDGGEGAQILAPVVDVLTLCAHGLVALGAEHHGSVPPWQFLALGAAEYILLFHRRVQYLTLHYFLALKFYCFSLVWSHIQIILYR